MNSIVEKMQAFLQRKRPQRWLLHRRAAAAGGGEREVARRRAQVDKGWHDRPCRGYLPPRLLGRTRQGRKNII